MGTNKDQGKSMNFGLFREIKGFSSARTFKEKNAILEAEKRKSFTAFVQKYGCPFGSNGTMSISEGATDSTDVQEFQKVH
jgi:hypothetical protein